ncbi:MAG TPA: hypothetical protein VKE22_15960 [Haliangiales bacterium]|nr:hypothetical protein [Haliangiales bacterium]
MRMWALVVLAACSKLPSPGNPQTPAQRAAAATAVAELRAARFEQAASEADAVLKADPRNSLAAAVRAFGRYQGAMRQLVLDFTTVAAGVTRTGSINHEYMRSSLEKTVGALAEVDRDLGVAAADEDFSLELCLACWTHDWNRNGRIDRSDELLFQIEVDANGNEIPEGDPRRKPTFHFDVGDVHWARAMVSFQAAVLDILLAYRWNELDRLMALGRDEPQSFTIHVGDAARARAARDWILAGCDHADRARRAYLAETDDDREWVPNPHQKNHPVPLEVDDALFETWAGVTGDARKLLQSKTGISLRDAASILDSRIAMLVPDAYIDVGAMFERPSDIVLDTKERGKTTDSLAAIFHGLLGNGYRDHMEPSPLVARLKKMAGELDRGEDTFDRKMRYLFWLN